jgi:hypothetical protein
MHLLADHGIGTDAAQAQAVDGLDLDATFCCGFRTCNKRFNTARLARLGAAELEDRMVCLLGLEVVIEADHALHLGAGQVEGLGDGALGVVVDAAELGLNVMQNREKGAFAATVRRNDLVQPVGLDLIHAHASPKLFGPSNSYVLLHIFCGSGKGKPSYARALRVHEGARSSAHCCTAKGCFSRCGGRMCAGRRRRASRAPCAA